MFFTNPTYRVIIAMGILYDPVGFTYEPIGLLYAISVGIIDTPWVKTHLDPTVSYGFPLVII